MAKKKQVKKQLLTPVQSTELQAKFINELDVRPEFSIDPDPTGELKLDDTKKDFIRHYINFKSIGTAAELVGIDIETAKLYFSDYNIQREIRRINRALYHYQFANKLVSIDEIGGYLSSLLTDENVPIADQLKTNEKLRVVELLLRLNELKASMNDPKELMNNDISIQIKNLSVTTIKQLLQQNNVIKEKNEAIQKIDDGNLTMEDKDFLRSLPLPELLKTIEDINNNGGKNVNQ